MNQNLCHQRLEEKEKKKKKDKKELNGKEVELVERVKNINVSYVKLIVKKGDELVYKYFTERLAKYLYFNIAILYKI